MIYFEKNEADVTENYEYVREAKLLMAPPIDIPLSNALLCPLSV